MGGERQEGRELDDATACEVPLTAPPAPAARLAWLSREVRILSAVNFVSAVGFGIQSPTIPVFALQLGVGSAMVGMIIAAFAFGRMVANVPGGRLVDRFGARGVLVGGLGFLALCSVLAGLSMQGWQLVLFRGLCGLGSALYSVAAMALLIQSTAATHRGRVVGLYMGAFYVGATAGPAIGATMVGLSPRIPFFLYGAGVACCAVFVLQMLRRVPQQAAAPLPGKQEAPNLREVLGIQAFRCAILCNLGIGWASYGVRVALLPLFLIEVIKAPAMWIGIALALGALVQAAMLPFAGTLADLVGRKPALVLGQAAVLGAYLLVLAVPQLWAYLACFVLIALGTALCVTAGSALVGDLAKGRPGSGSLVGSYQMAADVGTMLGAVLTGWLAQHFSYGAAFGLTAAALALGLASAARLRTGTGQP